MIWNDGNETELYQECQIYMQTWLEIFKYVSMEKRIICVINWVYVIEPLLKLYIYFQIITLGKGIWKEKQKEKEKNK